MRFDYCVIGAGIVGLASANKILEANPGASLLLLDKEERVAVHQTGHNSGVIHAGIYYEPGSLKAKLCRAGAEMTRAFCTEHQIPFEQCGKLIVATNAKEVARIDALYARAAANGLAITRLERAELREREPQITGIAALLSPETGIVDYTRVCEKLAETARSAGAEIRFGVAVEHIKEGPDSVEIGAAGNLWTASRLVVCAGLQSDRLARLAGLDIDFRIVPFRGEYFRLRPEKSEIIRHLIYPAPDPELPFLGIHLTRMIDGSVTVGPNAVLGLAREGYAKFSIDASDAWNIASFPGFWKLIFANRKHALHELKGSLSKRAYLEECRKYCPSLELEDLLPYQAGIRAQIVTSDGKAFHDFLIKETDRMLHVCNAPSPAATSALPIGQMIAEKVTAQVA
ncbi:hydroxyglutarate oxidase [Devosia insulae DS-56]|uniref:Hydroxyglutarate oxidase n=1 Tax=Devosia insulae DS-56 TaxID=1116389 RepID=A0A1E5XM46_9HYPH|nr:L-2-hydroxyglutarate oxidase [Devosia insulae]OEO29667.1 hydroxyglutarate oxidase [Devosia insulae DS-56]